MLVTFNLLVALVTGLFIVNSRNPPERWTELCTLTDPGIDMDLDLSLDLSLLLSKSLASGNEGLVGEIYLEVPHGIGDEDTTALFGGSASLIGKKQDFD